MQSKMEKLKQPKLRTAVAVCLSSLAITGCFSEQYLTDTGNVRCDGRETIAELPNDSMTAFIVHSDYDDSWTAVRVRRSEEGISVSVGEGSHTVPVPVIEGSRELDVIAAGGVYSIDASKDSVVIQGDCSGL